jgi:diacylglycerol kinase family enzyme
MYYYILDQQAYPPESFERLQIQLHGLLAEFNISGEFARVTSLRTMRDCVDTASLRGAKTLVACGSDETFNLMLANLQARDFTVAFVPFEPKTSYLATILGLPDLPTAVKTIAARRIERIDLARAGNFYFISWLEFGVTSKRLSSIGLWQQLKLLTAPGIPIQVRIDNTYTLEIECLGGLIVNSRSTSAFNQQLANPTDGYLDLLIMEKLKSTEVLRYRNAISNGLLETIPHTSVIKCKRIEFLQPDGIPVTVSSKVLTKFPVSVEIIPQQMRVIVGKNRTF